MKKPFLFLLLLLLFNCGWSQSLPYIQILTSGTKTSLRGLSVVNNEVIWVSGSNGTIGKSTNGGKDWKWLVVKGFEKSDFRDIEAFDGSTAIIMAVGAPAYILRTADGGNSWKVVYENKSKGMFLDAMEFWNEQAGIVIGDPINGKFFIARTFDGGSSWREVPSNYLPLADSGEACFAASGTNIRALDNDEAVFVSGGLHSNVYIRNEKLQLPILQGTETSGANSITVWDRFKKKGGYQLVVVGGDFNNDTVARQNCYYSTDRGKSWHASKVPPNGYRSCVEYLAKKQLITCGLTGVDYTFDNANTWQPISTESFHVVRIAKTGTSVFLAGNNGKVGVLVFTGLKK
ncbi:MAG: oxidoreductase [Flavisolibacter sp.]